MSIIDRKKLYPLKFQPIYMERVWGGTMMSEVLDRQLPEHNDPIGESWELVDRDDVNSVVCNGEFSGVSLAELIRSCGVDLMGRKAGNRKNFPLMVKLIDAGEINVTRATTNEFIYVHLMARSANHEAEVMIIGSHTGVTLLKKDGVLRQRYHKFC